MREITFGTVVKLDEDGSVEKGLTRLLSKGFNGKVLLVGKDPGYGYNILVRPTNSNPVYSIRVVFDNPNKNLFSKLAELYDLSEFVLKTKLNYNCFFRENESMVHQVYISSKHQNSIYKLISRMKKIDGFSSFEAGVVA